VAGAPRPDELTDALTAAGFEQVCIEYKEHSSEYIKEWLPGSGAEDYVISANITAVKPSGAIKSVAADAMPSRMRKFATSGAGDAPAPPPPKA